MDTDLKDLIGHIGAIVLIVGSLVARYRGTDPKKPVLDRIATMIDVTQIFDSTRKLKD